MNQNSITSFDPASVNIFLTIQYDDQDWCLVQGSITTEDRSRISCIWAVKQEVINQFPLCVIPESLSVKEVAESKQSYREISNQLEELYRSSVEQKREFNSYKTRAQGIIQKSVILRINIVYTYHNGVGAIKKYVS